METVTEQVMRRIEGKESNTIFLPKDFSDLANRSAVDQALSRLVKRGMLTRVGAGMYVIPRINSRFGIEVPPSADAIAQAAARKTERSLQISGARAANLFGLSEQIPAQNVYLTDGKTRRLQSGGQTIELRHSRSRSIKGIAQSSGAVIEALRYLGRKNVDERTILRLRERLSLEQKQALARDAVSAPKWMRSWLTAVGE